jgi:integrase
MGHQYGASLRGRPFVVGTFVDLYTCFTIAFALTAHTRRLVVHEPRHTAAALAIAEGAHPLAIKERLGHSSMMVTMDRYGELLPRLDEAIAEGLDRTFRDSRAAWVRSDAA